MLRLWANRFGWWQAVSAAVVAMAVFGGGCAKYANVSFRVVPSDTATSVPVQYVVESQTNPAFFHEIKPLEVVEGPGPNSFTVLRIPRTIGCKILIANGIGNKPACYISLREIDSKLVGSEFEKHGFYSETRTRFLWADEFLGADKPFSVLIAGVE